MGARRRVPTTPGATSGRSTASRSPAGSEVPVVTPIWIDLRAFRAWIRVKVVAGDWASWGRYRTALQLLKLGASGLNRAPTAVPGEQRHVSFDWTGLEQKLAAFTTVGPRPRALSLEGRAAAGPLAHGCCRTALECSGFARPHARCGGSQLCTSTVFRACGGGIARPTTSSTRPRQRTCRSKPGAGPTASLMRSTSDRA